MISWFGYFSSRVNTIGLLKKNKFDDINISIWYIWYDKYVKNTNLYLSHPLVSLTICLNILYSFFQSVFLWIYKPKFVFDRIKDRQLNWNCYKNIWAFIQNIVVYTCSMTAYDYALKIDSLSFECSCPIY